MEKVLGMSEHIKCGLPWEFFLLNNAPWSDRLVNVDNNQIEILRIICTIQDEILPSDLKYLQQRLKTIYTSLFMLVTLRCGFHIS